MAVAGDHLRRDRLDRETQARRDRRLHPGIDMGEGADGAGDGAGRNFAPRGGEPDAIAGELGVVAGELEAEGGRLGMDAVAAADRGRVLVLDRAPLQRRQHGVEVGGEQLGRLRHLQGKAGVQHVAAGHAEMQEAAFRPDRLAEPGQEGDHVVAGLVLDRVDPFEVGGREAGESGAAAVADDRGRTLGDAAEPGHRLGGEGLDLEPDAEPVLGRPDRGHLRAGVARDHEPSLATFGPCGQ